MLYRYIAVISEAEGVFYAKVPDIVGCITTANNLQEAIMLITRSEERRVGKECRL